MSFLMISLAFLYGECIDRPGMSEQKKPFEYVPPLSTNGVGTIRNHCNYKRETNKEKSHYYPQTDCIHKTGKHPIKTKITSPHS